ncbi:MAG: hypothetical protein A2X80_03255 [Geobacteraceae bacterium GWB2_52_12]|nr:MAG: hypothetical protein A2X80_03255 [Geobacteraceae bacterium GWB2_52_12]
MTEQICITCPECGFRKNVPKTMIPEAATRGNCPSCRQSFALNDATVTACPPPAAEESPPPLPPSAPPAFSRAVSPPVLLTFSFTGSARDYFGIWIVNTLLKLVTFGIYSAWAKVRKRRFFYGSTTLGHQPFEYLADPLALFKGWVIAAVAFLLYALGSQVSPLLSMVVGLVIFAVFPWLLVRSRMFNACNSSHRNIRFAFQPDYSQAYMVYAALPIVTMSTLGLLAPYTLFRQQKFMTESSSYGATPFVFTATAKDFYMASLRVLLVFVGAMVLLGIMFALGGGMAAAAPGSSGKWVPGGLALIPMFAFPLVYFIVIVYGQTLLANLTWNATSLAGNRFRSTLRTRDMAMLFVTNALAILFSLGLLMPWAAVRLTRYRFDNLSLLAESGLDGIVAAAENGPGVNATGEEIGDVFGMSMDISL